jgi:hypothetical protein
MSKVYLAMAAVILVMVFGACSKPAVGPPIGGPCTYVDVPGMATIVSVEQAPSNEYNCADAVKVTFDFVPTDPAAIGHYRHPGWKDTGNHFTLGAGMNPPKTWALERGLTAGSEFACVRSESTSGACTPVVFLFPGINVEGWDKYCFEK